MTELVCLFISLAIFSSYYSVLSFRFPESVLHKLLAASVLTCAQIILSELILGLFHELYLSFVIIVNLSIAALLLTVAQRSGRNGRADLQNDLIRAKEAIGAALDGSAVVLGVLAAVVYAWVLAASYYLPPRGVDDLAYHLPAVFEYARSHEIRLLPLMTIKQFAFPENAELLFLWPVLFTHDQRMVDGANLPFVLLSVLAVYALLRQFSLPKRDALFAALLYALCPVVLMQAGVNYVDIIVSLFLLLSLFFALRYHAHRRPLDLYLAGLSIGLMCGMKYTAPFLALPLQLLIWPALRRGNWRHAIGYLAIVALAGGWWYLRNAWVLGEPLYPMQFQSAVREGLVNARGGSVLQDIRYNLPYWFARYPLMDSGVGTYDGGFGLVFWGMCCSSWVYVAVRSLFTFGSQGFPRLVVLGYLPAGFLLLLAFPPRVVDFDGRLAMFVVAIGLFAFGEVLRIMNDKATTTIIKGICIVCSVITVSLLFVSVQPSYRFLGAISDRRNNTGSSEFKYLANSIDLHAVLRPAWELLDLLTRDVPEGLNVSLASDIPLYLPAPVFGSKLQNRVLNMGGESGAAVDAYLCSFSEKGQLDHPVVVRADPVPDTRDPATIRDVMSRGDYVAVLQSDHASLLLRRAVFERPDTQRVLRAYYRTYWPEAIDIAERLDGNLEANIPVITPSEIGYGVRSVDMIRGRRDRVYLTLVGGEEGDAARKDLRECYTFGRQLSGYRSQKIAQVVYQGKELDVLLNRRF